MIMIGRKANEKVEVEAEIIKMITKMIK